ncbi:MAG TPA: hypothetical protein VMU13_03770 [Candidatus Paceibacterota bacterium]|nr:hypothetical protein [Candidatus Paceibacterota bacterium]
MKKNGSKKIDSFEKLGELIVDEIQGLQEEMNDRFKKVDERFGQIDERFERVDERFEQIDERFKKIDQHFVDMEVQVRSGFDENKKIFDRQDTRIAALEYNAFGLSDSQKISKK